MTESAKTKALHEIAEIIGRGIAPKYSEDGDYTVINQRCIRNGRIDYSNSRTHSSALKRVPTNRQLQRGDVLVNSTGVGTLGRTAGILEIKKATTVDSHVTIIRPHNGTVARWLAYALSMNESAIELMARGSTGQTELPAELLSGLPIHVPPSRIQQAIVEVLGALDDKIAANDKSRQASGELARAKFEQAAKTGARHTIRDVASLVTRGITPKYAEADGVPVLNQKCVRDQWVGLTPARITDSSKIRPEKVLQRDDVLVNSTGFGTLGRAARWNRNIDATVDSHISIVRFDPDCVDPVCAGFGLLRLENQIESLAEGSTGQTELRRDLLASLEILVPSKEAQTELGKELSALDAHALALEDESSTLAQTRDELLPLLMSGKIRVRDAERTVEEVV